MKLVSVRNTYIPYDQATLAALRSKGFASTVLTKKVLAIIEDSLGVKSEIIDFAQLEQEFLQDIKNRWAHPKRKIKIDSTRITMSCPHTPKARAALEALATKYRTFYRRWGLVLRLVLSETSIRYMLTITKMDEIQPPVLPVAGDLIEKTSVIFGFTKMSVTKVTPANGHVRFDIACHRKAADEWLPPAFSTSCLASEVKGLAKFLNQLSKHV